VLGSTAVVQGSSSLELLFAVSALAMPLLTELGQHIKQLRQALWF
jgi:hypothetical protein